MNLSKNRDPCNIGIIQIEMHVFEMRIVFETYHNLSTSARNLHHQTYWAQV